MSFIDQSPNSQSEVVEDNVNIGEMWRAVARRRSFVAQVTGGLVLLGIGYVLVSHPSFTETGSLYTQGLSPSATGDTTAGTDNNSFLGSLGNYQSITDSETQVDTLTSPLLLQQAVMATGLNARVTNADSASPRYFAWHLFHGAKISAFAPRDTALQALYANFSDPSIKADSYQIIFQAGGHYQILNNGAAVLTGALGTPAAGGGLQLLLQAPASGYIPDAGSSYHLLVVNPIITAESLLNGKLSVTPGGTPTLPSDVINISLKWSNPYQGTQFVDQLMNDYINTTVSWNSSAAGTTVDFINSQLKNVQSQLASANQQLAAYQQQTGVLSPSDNAQNLIKQESQYELQQAQLKVKVVALQQMRQALRTPSDGINPYLLGLDSDTTLSALAEKLGETNATLQAMRVQFTGNAPEVQAEEAQVQQLQVGIRSLVQNQLDEAQSNLDTTNAVIADFQKKIASMPAQSLKVVSLTRSSEVLGQLYVLLMQKQQEAALAKAAEVSTTRILTPAQMPFSASAPRPGVIIGFTLVMGLLLSTGWVLAQRGFSGRFSSESEVRRVVKSSVYGTIPKLSKNDSTGILAASAYSGFSEAFRIARNNLYHAIPGNRPKAILLSSASVGDGKSTVAANLARTLADDGKRVVLVDADLRMGQLHHTLGLDQSPGLSDWLIDGEAVALQVPDGQRFAVLTSGVKPPNPAELMNDPGLKEIIKTLRANYDFIVFDTAPVPAVSDPLILARQVDLVLSVIHLGHTRHRDVAAHESILTPLAKRHGVIINGTPAENSGYYDYVYGEVPVKAGWLRRLQAIRNIMTTGRSAA